MVPTFLVSAAVVIVIGASSAAAPRNPYLDAGLGAVDRVWDGRDYRKAAEVFGRGRLPLPTIREPRGRALILRMTSPENLERGMLANRSLPIEPRMQDWLSVVEGTQTLLKLYVSRPDRGQSAHAELAHLLAFQVRAAGYGMMLLAERLRTAPRDDKYEVRVDAFRRGAKAAAGLYRASLIMVCEPGPNSAEERSHVLASARDALPMVQDALPLEYASELRNNLVECWRRASARDRTLLESMLRQLETGAARGI